MEVLSLRRELEELIEASQAATAAGRLEVLWHLEPGPALAGFCNLGFRETAPLAPTQTVPLRDLASFTVEPIVPILRAHAFVN